jgi:DNA-binding PadR family transcriptional regulator
VTRLGTLGEFEHLVLLAVARQPQGMGSARIGRELEERAGRRVSRGALYSALDRLEQKGYLRWKVESAPPDRGGHPPRRFAVTRAGRTALGEYRRAIDRLSLGVEES